MNIGIFKYDAFITEAFGPEEGPMEQIKYSAVQANTSDPIRVTRAVPRRRKKAGTEVRRTFVGDLCWICKYAGELYLIVQEDDATTECDSSPPPPPPVFGNNGDIPSNSSPITSIPTAP